MISRVFIGLVAMAAAFSGFVQQPSAAPPVLLRDVRLIDGTGAAPREHVSLLLRDGRIQKIGGRRWLLPRV